MAGAPLLYGRPPAEARRRMGTLRQLAGIDDLVETQGAARGARRLTLTSGGGLTVNVHPDRALDLGAASYRGVPIAWQSPTGFAAPGRTVDRGTEWLRTFGGGLLASCGLDTFGPASTDEGVHYPMHGRIGSVPATVTRTETTDDELIVEGEVRQTAVFGENLLLRRRIRVPIGGSGIIVEDRVTNEASTPAGHMVLYHANLGWPLLDDSAVLAIPSNSVAPRDAAAEAGMADWFDISGPVPGYAEQVFTHDFTGCGDAEVSVDNPDIDLRVAIRFDSETLPGLHQWKMLGEGHYVLGLEPTSIDWSRGRAAAREAGTLPYLEPGESVSYRVEFHCGPSRIPNASVERSDA
ncbi:aldose 1-epimerase family protein [Leucobacter sp. CSA1]|uniref:Aldose 1-epimerase family protein n=1 Tax=Leucobacter chromiisoli TaxID=2796471 RepID=A0A934UUZ2_9MICO|nr:aldose 1-epimerase family protein [Leucobacter chromiisoli]MBK0418683.1 aldose 1-epimerase family protein [Leucobacter chromiisoli]